MEEIIPEIQQLVTVDVLRSLFDFNSSAVRVGGVTTDPFCNEMGLLQGSILSHVLYTPSFSTMLSMVWPKSPAQA